ncbi:MAG TPA: ATP-binding protein [Anaerolineae bacterium]|nr:ATP-binding protein [Anaerolineae bacterium]
MFRSITPKLVLSFLLVSVLGTSFVAALAGQLAGTAFDDFLFSQTLDDFAERLTIYYDNNGSWDNIRTYYPMVGPRRNGRNDPPPRRNNNNPQLNTFQPPPPGGDLGGFIALVDANGYVIIPGYGYDLNQRASKKEMNQGYEIENDGQTIGYLVVQPGAFRNNNEVAAFLTEVRQVLIRATLVATLIALAVSIFLANTLTRPLRELTQATHILAKGNLDHKVDVHSQDELGQLADAFNQMGTDLAEAQNMRRQLTADIAHDLRTPLSIILGHAEALSDGVLPPSTDTFELIHDEAQRLNGLIEDLRTLSLAETGELSIMPRPTPAYDLLQRITASYTPQAQQKNITINLQAPPNLPTITVDPDRMLQVLNNLMSNAIRYTPLDGQITIDGYQNNDRLHITLHNTGPHIPADQLTRIFHRFYRVDKSRQRHNGGSGLGLAIAQSIIVAHNGQITVESAPNHGVTFIINLPLTPQPT